MNRALFFLGSITLLGVMPGCDHSEIQRLRAENARLQAQINDLKAKKPDESQFSGRYIRISGDFLMIQEFIFKPDGVCTVVWDPHFDKGTHEASYSKRGEVITFPSGSIGFPQYLAELSGDSLTFENCKYKKVE